ncbi:MAG: TPM domain-containing protein [Patescibacteria group bacterium]
MYLKKITMRFFIKFVLSFFLIANILFGVVLAFNIPKAEGYVLDQAQVFSDAEESALESQIKELDLSRTVEVGVLTVKTLDGEDVATVAVDVANKWGVGKKDVDNGVMILIAVDDRDWFIASGYGVEGVLPDAILKRIGEKDFPANFRSGNYYQGIIDVLSDMEGYLAGDESVVSGLGEGQSDNMDGELSSWQIWYLIILFFVIFVKAFGLMKDKGFWWKMLVVNFVFLIANLVVLGMSFAIIMAFISVFLDILIFAAANSKGGGGSSSYSGGSSGWSSGGGSSFGGGGSSFGGGSFGGGGSGGKW